MKSIKKTTNRNNNDAQNEEVIELWIEDNLDTFQTIY